MEIFSDKEDRAAQKLATLRRKEEEESVKILSQKYKIPYMDLATFPIDTSAIRTVPEADARQGELVVFSATAKQLKVGVRNPEKDETKAILKRLEENRYTADLFLVSRSSLEHAWVLYGRAPEARIDVPGTVTVAYEGAATRTGATLAAVTASITEKFLARATEALETILGGALALDASDIHIEPQEKDVRLRFRIDGVLYDVTTLPQKLFGLLLSRIKLVSELKLNIHDRAQDGRFTIRTSAAGDIETRASVLPGPYGENIVLRILNPSAIAVAFEKLGMQPWVAAAMEAELSKPNGMILTTGPTGSGKTTTLYAFIKKVYSPEVKIITIEDPIEYHVPGIEQTQVAADKGYDFANGLRSIVRQDPDVILVGEIRDLETAETALHAALTGHLVFSTLHTNDAAGTVPRLIDMGVRPSIIAPAVNVAMAQRLLRRLCDSCKVATPFTDAERTEVMHILKQLPPAVHAPEEKTWTTFRPREGGCVDCRGLGYRSRIGIFEIFPFDESIEQIIAATTSVFEMRRRMQERGQITMEQDGILKILAGTTDLAELRRTVGSLEKTKDAS